MRWFPLFLSLRDAPCLVVGGGDVALRKVRLLRDAGARVTVVAPTLHPDLDAFHRDGAIDHAAEPFRDDHLSDCTLAIAATDDAAVNRAVADAARARRVPVNVVDTPELCSFVFPAIVDRGPLTIAVSTGGAAPVLARLIRARLETEFPAAYGQLAALAERFRERVKHALPGLTQRRRYWETVLQGPAAERMLAGQPAEAERLFEAALTAAPAADARGEVYLIGGGPGDPDLLTFRALRLLQQADVVLYDRLVSPEVVAMARRDADRIYVGKRNRHHSMPQETINETLIRLAQEGKRVARLKGGDPFIFGRGGEEIERLMDAGIPFQVVPGITAASGCASYAGIPLTHRDHAHSCQFLTAHPRKGYIDLPWPSLVQPHQTLVFYMALQGIDMLCEGLLSHGLPADTPAALIQQGTTPHQRVVTGTVATLPERVRAHNIQAPTLVIVGSVVTLRDKLAWFEPDAGKKDGATDPPAAPSL